MLMFSFNRMNVWLIIFSSLIVFIPILIANGCLFWIILEVLLDFLHFSSKPYVIHLFPISNDYFPDSICLNKRTPIDDLFYQDACTPSRWTTKASNR